MRRQFYTYISRHLGPPTYLFSTRTGNRVTVRNFQRDMGVYGKHLHTTDVRFSPHTLRHYAASRTMPHNKVPASPGRLFNEQGCGIVLVLSRACNRGWDHLRKKKSRQLRRRRTVVPRPAGRLFDHPDAIRATHVTRARKPGWRSLKRLRQRADYAASVDQMISRNPHFAYSGRRRRSPMRHSQGRGIVATMPHAA